MAAVAAALVLAFFSIDLGPAARQRAEREATNYLERPMHIGTLKARIWPGSFELDDVVIEGLHKDDQPFLSAKKIIVSLTWRTILSQKELFLEVRMTDWRMAIERWPNGQHSLPKILPKNRDPRKPAPFTTTANFVYADRGEFTYVDHGVPWKVVARNLSFDLVRANNLKAYVGTSHFTSSTVQIQNYRPMATSMTTRLTIDGSMVRLPHIDLITDGSRSSLHGYVDFSKWPEQAYEMDSDLDFKRMREIYFPKESWRVNGDGKFKGTFRLFQKGGYELKGQFASPLATLDTPGTRLNFPRLHGALLWAPDRFTVTDAGADFYGGPAGFSYTLAPLGTPGPPTATFVADYDNLDLETFARAIQWRTMDLRGRASGHNEMSWVNGRLSQTRTGSGRVVITPPEGVNLASAAPDPQQRVVAPAAGPFQKDRPLGPLPVAGEVAYRYDRDGLDLEPSWITSPSTYVAFRGRADFGPRSRLPFHVASTDWQESDRLLVAILTAAGAPTSAVPVGGFGQFDGEMTESFSQPRIEGRFAGEAVNSWGVTWGRVIGDIVIQNQYVTVSNGAITGGPDQTILANGRFSLGFRQPAESAGEMKDVRVRVTHWPLTDFRQAFNLNDWPVEGVVASADIKLDGPYHGPLGDGNLRIDRGAAWGEAFETVRGELTFDGTGLQVSRIVMAKNVGQVNASAVLKWDGTYAFDARGERIPVESLTSFAVPRAPLSGVLHFTASGEGEFAAPSYEFRPTIPDLSAGNQGIGAVSGVLQVRHKTLFIQQLEAHSVLLQLSGSGSIALDGAYDSRLNFRFTSSRLDPYLPLLAPKAAEQLSQYTRAVVGGTVQVQGELRNPSALNVYGTVEEADLTLFDYKLANDGAIKLKFENNVATISHLVLVGSDTSLAIEGDIPRSEAPMRLTATGKANLAILQLLSSNLASSGVATINATFGGTPQNPIMSGEAAISDGRLRYRSFPHGLEQINGPITFNADRINVDDVHARMAGGDVTFSGAIELKGLAPDQFALRAEGRSMDLRFPTGFRSTVNASLTLTGPVGAPTLAGDVDVIRSRFVEQIDNDILALAALGSPLAAGGGAGSTAEGSAPMKLDVHLRAPANTLSINMPDIQVFGQANLTVRGTIDAPSVIGLVRLDRGTISFNGNRYTLQPSTIDFFNAARIEPSFDVTLGTRARVPGQTYDVTFRITGQQDRLDFSLTSDPYSAAVRLGERAAWRAPRSRHRGIARRPVAAIRAAAGHAHVRDAAPDHAALVPHRQRRDADNPL